VIQAQSNFARGSHTNTTGTVKNTSKSYDMGVNAQPMFVFFPSPKWALEAGLGSVGFTHSRDLTADKRHNNFHLTYGGLSFGATYYIYGAE
jgi:hypothetical protein